MDEERRFKRGEEITVTSVEIGLSVDTGSKVLSASAAINFLPSAQRFISFEAVKQFAE